LGRRKIEKKLKKRARKAGRALLGADAAVAAAVERRKDHPVLRAAALFSQLGDQPPMLGLALGTLASGIAQRDARLTRAGARMAAAHLLATAAKNIGKKTLDRTRPRSDSKHRVERAKSDPDDKSTQSFPSGHSAGALAVARAFGRDFPEHRAEALGAAAAVALGQMPRRAHYLSDVGAGMLIGLAAEALARRLIPPASR
jgi:membrane-associated phospholipid phosphatase